MPVYGEYETVAELGRSGSSCVYRARPADGGWDLGFDDLGTDANFALKTFQVRNAEDAGGIESNRFLERVRAQKRLNASGALHWAPILDSGVSSSEAWYVTAYYPLTAAGLSRSRGGVNEAILYQIVTGVLQGLLELRQNQGRPHGNLKAANVLIKGSAKAPAKPNPRITSADIHLTDPAREDDATIAGEAEDLYNLGEIIHELVLGNKFPGQHVWPLLPSRAWTLLGKKASQWLTLCNHLLSPRAAENWLRVDDILEEVSALRPARKRLRSRKALVAAAALLVVGGLCAGEYFRYTAQWRYLCGDYDLGAGALSASLARLTPPEIAGDAYLKEHVVQVLADARQNNVELDPRIIADASLPPGALAEHPPLSPSAIWKTEKASHIVSRVEESLSPQRWQALADLTAWRGQYQKQNWHKLAEYAANLIDASKPSANDWAQGIAAVVEGHARLRRLDDARQAARSRGDHLRAAAQANPALRDQINEFQTQLRSVTDADLILPSSVAADRLTQRLSEIETTSARFDAAVPMLAEAARRQRAYEVRGWAGPARVVAGLLDRARPDGDLATLSIDLAAAKRQWEQVENLWAEIEQRRRLLETSGDRILSTYHQFIVDARLGDEPDLLSLARRLERINDEPNWAAAAKVVAAPQWARIDVVDFAQKSDAHRGFAGKPVATPQILKLWLTDVEGYGSQLASATIKPDATHAHAGQTPQPPNVVTVPRPTTVASAQTSRVPTTTAPAVVAAVKPATKPAPDPQLVRREAEIAAFITECREVALPAKTPDLKEIWRLANDQFADRIAKDHKLYTPALRGQRDRLRGRLLQLDSAYQSALAPLALKPISAPWNVALIKALQSAASQPGGAVKEAARLAASDDSKFEAALSSLVEDDEQQRASAARLVVDASHIDHLLAAGFEPSDKQSGLAGALASVQSSDYYKIAAVRQTLEPLMKPVDLVQAETGAPALRQLSANSQLPLGIRLAAWSRIGDSVTKETFLGDIKIASDMLSGLRQAQIEESRIAKIKNRLETDLRQRWQSLVEHATRDEDVAAAIELRAQTPGVDLEQLSIRARFNFALHDLRTTMASGDSKQISAARAKVKQLIASLDPAAAKAPAVATLALEMDRMDHPPAIDFAQLGPMSHAAAQATGGNITWSATAEESGDKVTYRTMLPTDAGREEVSLVFRRVHPSAAQSSWVCTNEASMGLFSDLLTASSQWSNLRSSRLLPDYDPSRGDPRVGPRTWEWPRYGRTPGVVRSLVWLSSDFVPPRLDHYPDAIGSEFNRSVIRDAQGERSEELNPSRNQPMQYVSVKAAQLAAAAAGCRIPTVAEWQAALKQADRRTALNLRDHTWKLELDHMNKAAFNGQCRPDAGMFAPAGEKPSDAVYTRADGSEINDGILWFRPVPAAPSDFVDLVGNVAEFVSDDAGKVYVMGGSAMSPPSRALDRQYPIDADQMTKGFSDTGFRLSFSGPQSGSEKFKEAVAGGWYLLAK